MNPTEHRDRSTLILVAGILVILGGCLCALFIPLMIFGQSMAAKSQEVAPSLRPVIPGILLYGGMAGGFIILGIGAIRKRRWAGHLLHAIAWLWLAIGLTTSLIFLGFIAAKGTAIFGLSGDTQLPQGALGIILAISLTFLLTIYVFIPGLLLLVFGNRNVRATFQAQDSRTRWTDPIPTSVLVLVLLMGMGSISMFGTFAYTPVLPLFGSLISGTPAGLSMVAIAGLWLALAVGLAHLRPWAWWGTLGIVSVFALSAGITFTQVDLLELYQKMDFPAEQLAQIKASGLLDTSWMPWIIGFSMLPFLGLVLAVGRHFRLPMVSTADR